MSLAELFNDAARRKAAIDDCCDLLDSEVSKKKGLSGFAIKAGYKFVKGVKPGFIFEAIDQMFDEWITELEPLWREANGSGEPPVDFLVAQKERVAETLLTVTDEKSRSADGASLRSAYGKLRPSAKKHVEEAVPGLCEVLVKYLD